MSDLLFEIVAAIVKIAFLLAVVVGVFTPLLTLAERKISSWMQDRIGPNRAYIFKIKGKPFTLGGLFHTMADAVKMFVKEYTVPAKADKFLFNLAPILGLVPALLVFAVIPFGPTIEIMGRQVPLQIANVNIGLLFVFALGSLGVYGAAIAGWASNNKLALLGSLRASAQTISYEVMFGLTLVGLMMTFGTVELNKIVEGQKEFVFGFLPKWGIFLQPVGFILFFTAAMAENKRVPFDLPEGESEIIGYFVEYSSMGFGLFMTAEFIEMVVIAFLCTTLFFGGYLIPGLDGTVWTLPFSMGELHLAQWFAVLLQFGAFIFKVLVLLFLQFVIRWALPRFRYDQLMRLGWKMMLPIALLNLLVTAILLMLDPSNQHNGMGEITHFSAQWLTCFGLFCIGVFILSVFYKRAEPKSLHLGHDHGHDDATQHTAAPASLQSH